jgi:hypothetical protein
MDTLSDNAFADWVATGWTGKRFGPTLPETWAECRRRAEDEIARLERKIEALEEEIQEMNEMEDLREDA